MMDKEEKILVRSRLRTMLSLQGNKRVLLILILGIELVKRMLLIMHQIFSNRIKDIGHLNFATTQI